MSPATKPAKSKLEGPRELTPLGVGLGTPVLPVGAVEDVGALMVEGVIPPCVMLGTVVGLLVDSVLLEVAELVGGVDDTGTVEDSSGVGLLVTLKVGQEA